MSDTDNKAPREFWIDTYTNRHDILDEEETDGYYAGDALRKHPRQGPPLFQSSLIHVIEKYAYDKLQQAYNDLKDRFKQEMINRGAEESYHENIQQVELIFKGDD